MPKGTEKYNLSFLEKNDNTKSAVLDGLMLTMATVIGRPLTTLSTMSALTHVCRYSIFYNDLFVKHVHISDILIDAYYYMYCRLRYTHPNFAAIPNNYS